MQLLRHGQSHFNKHFSVTRQDPGIIDPALTAEGRRQIGGVAEELAKRGLFWKRIIASPYWRALETAEILAKRLGLAIEVEPLVRERAFFACDIGSPRTELEQRFPEVAFGELPEIWWPHPDESEGSLLERCKRFRLAWAKQEDRAGLLVVTHWGFIRGLTGHSVENGSLTAFDPTLA